MNVQVISDRDARTQTGFARLMDASREAAEGDVRSELEALDAVLLAFETDARFSTADLLAKLDTGEIVEDDRICDWLLTLTVRNRLASRVR